MSLSGGSWIGDGGTGGNESQTPDNDEVEEEAAEALIPEELPETRKIRTSIRVALSGNTYKGDTNMIMTLPAGQAVSRKVVIMYKKAGNRR